MLTLLTSMTLELLPYVRDLWRRFMERAMEIEIYPVGSYHVQSLATTGDSGSPWWLYGRISISFVNHRTDRLERVIGAHVEWRRRRFHFWRKTMAQAPVFLKRDISRDEINIELPAMSKRYEARLIFDDTVNTPHEIPEWSELILVLDLVGPIRHIKRSLTGVKHDARMWKDPEQQLRDRIKRAVDQTFGEFLLPESELNSLRETLFEGGRQPSCTFDYAVIDGVLHFTPDFGAYMVGADGQEETLMHIANAHRQLLELVRGWNEWTCLSPPRISPNCREG